MVCIADAWRRATPIEAAQWFAALQVPWWVAGGWALDLFTGTQIRAHKDLDIGVLRRDVLEVLSALVDWEVFEAKNGVLAQLQSGNQPRAGVNSLWCRPARAQEWVLELMLDDAEDNAWVYRRDRRIRRPLETAIHRDPGSIPYLAPEIQLLFKSQATRPQDLADFECVLPRLDRAACAWLKGALAQNDPHHSWLPFLEQRLPATGSVS